MSVSPRNSWGVMTAFAAVTKGTPNTVLANVGVAIVIPPGFARRITKLGWRVDIAPDVAVGTVVGPTKWRVVVLQAGLPNDCTVYQTQAFPPPASHGEIPHNLSGGTPANVLYDEWLDFGAGSPGLNQLFFRDFPDSGPIALDTDTLTILLTPIIDAGIPAAPDGPANALMTLAAYGTGVTGIQYGGSPLAGLTSQPSIPRFDTPARSR